ncbi:MAG: Fe-S cluster assembly ATPase SufC [Acidimicrobiia bacterium]|nr:Fe-S cluster assembly ATPase SufC [bacterium]MXW58319.1 Fe-S cluster assembly ATPase SufC [Acidimicrobiia bacterium]MXZ78173.1 Fe-S cluster assembly ATPase SufC [Acidimicrobiia bacterium]MYB73901.1 Fe-S cluster assembly ATPase SufC [Acidimicrobiia bacterium]MYE72191.1 Fe-S cluster assembly ATPase SufC [Acidimicrobiia bacterium]
MSDSSKSELVVSDLHVRVGGQMVLNGVDLRVASGEVHAVMGPNGSGKSTLAYAIMGRPGYEITAGSITLNDVDLVDLSPWERAHAGLFSTQQYPTEVPGVGLENMLEEAVAAVGGDRSAVEAQVVAEAELVGFDLDLLYRSLNVDLSGGEMKRSEAVQLGVLRPRIAILDELDSGLDVDALAAVSHRIEQATHEDNLGVLAITHFSRLLTVLHADVVHILIEGAIAETGGPELAAQLEETGYDPWIDTRAESPVEIHSHLEFGGGGDPWP